MGGEQPTQDMQPESDREVAMLPRKTPHPTLHPPPAADGSGVVVGSLTLTLLHLSGGINK